MTQITLRRDAWHTDEETVLKIPDGWTVNVTGNQPLPALSAAEIDSRTDDPIDSPLLADLAKGKKSAVILVDDITRPTPADKLLPGLIRRLQQGGIPPEGMKILAACGSHREPTPAEIIQKVGMEIPAAVQIFTHECRKDCAQAGSTAAGTPVWLNQRMLASELKIGVGSVYPHPAAGFSGGGKIMALGAAGYETIRVLHDNQPGTERRTGEIDHPFRRQISEIARLGGLSFIVNVTLNQDRQICGLFAGGPDRAFAEAAAFARQHYTVPVDRSAEVVIADMYPFDMDFQYALDRGFWPFEFSSKHSVKIMLAHCPAGIGSHEFFPAANPAAARLKRRLKNFTFRDLFTLPARLRAVRRMAWRRNLEVIVVSPFITPAELKETLPRGVTAVDWESAVRMVSSKFPGQSNLRAALYRTAPLMLPDPGNPTP